MDRHEWTLKRNCSLSPRQFAAAWLVLGFLMLAVALPFVLHGAWYVLSFACVELVGLGAAFLHYARHATDREYIALEDGYLVVAYVNAGREQRIRFNSCHLRVEIPKRSDDLITLRCGGKTAQIGRHLALGRRRQFARELDQALDQFNRQAIPTCAPVD